MSALDEKYTIDKLYNNKISHFEKHESVKITKYESKIKEYTVKKNSLESESNPDIELLKEINTKIGQLENKIKKIKNKKDTYLLDNYQDLFSYFDVKQNIEKNNNPKKMIHNFFNKKKNDELYHDENYTNSIESYMKKNNFDLYSNQYLSFENSDENEVCERCNKGELIKSNHDGIMICNHCYCIFKFLINNDKPSYKEPPKEISFYAYRRINHFKEILSQFQAKESTDIPDDIILKIKNQIRKERISLNNLSNKVTKGILKKLGFNKYYEHIPFIKEKLGIKPPIMSPQLEETLCNLFIDIQIPYAKYCPIDRVNFLNYYYTLYKLCELLGERSYLEHFPMLKDQKKIEQDEIWKNICKELDWDFIPTL